MKALIVEKGRLRYAADLSSESRAGEVRLRPRLVGICRTDMELVAGYMNFEGIPGHEFVAEVLEDTPRFCRGALVVGEINCGCGTCEWCGRGMERHCPTRSVLGILQRPGAMADELSLPEKNLHAIPEGVSPEEAVFTEPLAAACRIIEQEILAPKSPVAILGDGRLGVLSALVLNCSGHRVTLFGHHASARRELLAGTGIIVKDAEEAKGRFDAVVEATGRPEGFATAFKLARPLGTIILKTTTFEPPPVHPAELVIDEVRVVGSRCGPFPPALELLRKKFFPLEKLIDSRFRLEDGVAAFETAKERGRLKALLEV